jgi:hypothetical protein
LLSRVSWYVRGVIRIHDWGCINASILICREWCHFIFILSFVHLRCQLLAHSTKLLSDSISASCCCMIIWNVSICAMLASKLLSNLVSHLCNTLLSVHLNWVSWASKTSSIIDVVSSLMASKYHRWRHDSWIVMMCSSLRRSCSGTHRGWYRVLLPLCFLPSDHYCSLVYGRCCSIIEINIICADIIICLQLMKLYLLLLLLHLLLTWNSSACIIQILSIIMANRGWGSVQLLLLLLQ